MAEYRLDFEVKHQHRILFSEDVFKSNAEKLASVIEYSPKTKFLVVVEEEILAHWSSLEEEITSFVQSIGCETVHFLTLPGGEVAKRDLSYVNQVWDAVEAKHIDRHSYIFAIGGGALLDVVGLAAATAHRGIRLVRFPTTTLSQDDSGVGVKNGVNAYQKKNFIGTFAVPYAVVNDARFLFTQPKRHLVAGLIEALKVALVKDGEFFEWIYENREKLAKAEKAEFLECIERSAMIHAKHITEGGDPFELGNHRPLDFGHWSAHKLEQLSNFDVSHAEAVGIGIAWDVLYSAKKEWITDEQANRVIEVIQALGMDIYHPLLHEAVDGRLKVFLGLDEFREHLGGELTLSMLKDLGKGFDVHELDEISALECLEELVIS